MKADGSKGSGVLKPVSTKELEQLLENMRQQGRLDSFWWRMS